MNRLVRVLLVAVVAALLTIGLIPYASPPPAQADATCTNGSDNWLIFRKYVDAYGRVVPLRCGYWNGQKGWGVMKLKAKDRWNVWYRDMIGATLEDPWEHWAQNTTTDIYVTEWQWDCDPVYRFRVIVNTSKPGTTYMQGVVNAYEELF